MKKAAKWVALFLLIATLTNSMIVQSSSSSICNSIGELTTETSYREKENEPNIGEEIVEWRENGVKHYYLGNGEYQAVVTATSEISNTNSINDLRTNIPSSGIGEDTYIDSLQPDEPHGSTSTLWVSNTQTTFYHGYLPILPENANIVSARLYFSYYYHISTGSLTVEAYPVLFQWEENELDWSTAASHSNLGLGASGLGTVSLPGTKAITETSVSITNAVKSWYECRKINDFGVALRRKSGTNNSVILVPREATSGSRPYYVINYTLTSIPIQNGTYYIQSAIPFDLPPEAYWACFMQKNYNTAEIYDSESDPDSMLFCEMATIDGTTQQKWVFEYLHNGYYMIRNASENKVLAVPAGSENQENAILVRETFTGNIRQQWKITTTINGTYKIKPRASESYSTDWVMGITDEYKCIGKNIKQIAYTSSGGLNDEWYLHRVGNQVSILGVNEGTLPSKWILSTVKTMEDLGFDNFNINYRDNLTKNNVLSIMDNATIYIGMAHGTVTKDAILLNASGSEKIEYTDIYYGTAKVNLSNCELMILLSCYIGDDTNGHSPCKMANMAGAQNVIGFGERILVDDAIEWLNQFLYYYYVKNESIYDACSSAITCGSYTDEDLIASYEIYND